eukprot:9360197-Pyramimonas_sp.AAC.1
MKEANVYDESKDTDKLDGGVDALADWKADSAERGQGAPTGEASASSGSGAWNTGPDDEPVVEPAGGSCEAGGGDGDAPAELVEPAVPAGGSCEKGDGDDEPNDIGMQDVGQGDLFDGDSETIPGDVGEAAGEGAD